jgi:hypothetical protein
MYFWSLATVIILLLIVTTPKESTIYNSNAIQLTLQLAAKTAYPDFMTRIIAVIPTYPDRINRTYNYLRIRNPDG